jgi:bifunctional non-homologous end joining protein LigD
MRSRVPSDYGEPNSFMSLREYARKRDFRKTKEPKAVRAPKKHSRFVVQKHEATQLHYDFRLELDGVLKSWAVPKGIPLRRGEKRLAIEVEDHPVSYLHFEGTIPKGQYGGGTVMVWDHGTYEVDEESSGKGLAVGKLHFTLHGEKLQGAWYLVKIRSEENQWLLIRSGNSQRPITSKQENSSSLSGKSMRQLANGTTTLKVSKTTRRPLAKAPRKSSKQSRPSPPRASLRFMEPMLATLVTAPPAGEWLYEMKFDGFRALAIKEGERLELLSRNEKDFTARFPEVVESLAKVKAEAVIMDGEIVALDPQGRSSFQLLQAREQVAAPPPIYFYAFDLLHLNGEDLREQPLQERKQQLERLLKKPPGVIRCSLTLGHDADRLLAKARKYGLEGIIGKKPDSVYEAGRRSGAWIKIKLHAEQEFVIGGYTEPEGSRLCFGALLIGFYRGRSLRFCGKVGTGFNAKLLKTLHWRFQPLRQPDCPFVNLPERSSGPYGAGVTAAEMKRCHWLQPQLVGQIRFGNWTRDEKLRHPVFLGLREDKDARDVVHETSS